MCLIQDFCCFYFRVKVAQSEATTPSGDDAEDESSSPADIKDPEDYKAIFQPKHELSKSIATLACNLDLVSYIWIWCPVSSYHLFSMREIPGGNSETSE